MGCGGAACAHFLRDSADYPRFCERFAINPTIHVFSDNETIFIAGSPEVYLAFLSYWLESQLSLFKKVGIFLLAN